MGTYSGSKMYQGITGSILSVDTECCSICIEKIGLVFIYFY
jgi:hypothetical protein